MGEFIDKTKGKIKQAIGDLTGNKELKLSPPVTYRRARWRGDERIPRAAGSLHDTSIGTTTTSARIPDASTPRARRRSGHSAPRFLHQRLRTALLCLVIGGVIACGDNDPAPAPAPA